MAENKKSFIAYSDWYGMLKACPDEVAGKLIKHVFAYVNDENPSTDDFIINALFEQIKCTLKRDLVKWENEREQRSKAGKKSAEQRATKFNERSTPFNEIERNSTVSVNVNVNDSVNENDKIFKSKNFEFYDNLINSQSWLESTAMQSKQKLKVDEVKSYLLEFTTDCDLRFDNKPNKKEFASHFIRWLALKETKKPQRIPLKF